ncbi:response regulator [Undibacterium sp. RuTC16W]|uniref:response regulator n=1 Tax=Undibacterium sp. RuTC16W TaxID=3413048 RepID=UPI003BF28E1D
MTETPILNILVLDDQGLVRAGMTELIRISEPRAKVFEASNYAMTIALLDKHYFQFAFLDFDLKAEFSGLDVLKYLHEQEMDTRAVMLSGCLEQDVVFQCLNAGACGYIPKDMSNNGVFRSALDTVLQGGIFLPEPIAGFNIYSNKLFPSLTDPSPESLGINGRCLEVLVYLCQGLSNKAIARKMCVEEGTIRKDYVPKLFRVFKVTRRTELLFEVSKRRIKLPKL